MDETRSQAEAKQPLASEGAIAEALQFVKYKIAILSGKGGVGKTATTVNLGAALQQAGFKVGIFDADLHGPSVPTMLGIKKQTRLNGAFWLDPVKTESGIKALSVALFWPGDMTPVMWRGQTKSRTIRQLLSAAKWGGLDFLLVDLPPGTGDEPTAILKSIPDLDGVIIVTTPQEVSTLVCSKAINASLTLGAKVLGLIENMSHYTCRCCGDVVHLFGQDKGRGLANMMDVPLPRVDPDRPAVLGGRRRRRPGGPAPPREPHRQGVRADRRGAGAVAPREAGRGGTPRGEQAVPGLRSSPPPRWRPRSSRAGHA